MKVLLFGDIHLSDRPPSLRKSTYADEILTKVAFGVAQAAKHKVDAIVSAGDVFHIKAPSRTSHRLVQALHTVIAQTPIPFIVVPGNHDMQHDRLESLAGQPLGALGRMEGVEILTGAHDSLPLFGLPYMQDWTKVPAVLEDEYKPWADRMRLERDEFPLLVTHAPIFPVGEDPPYETIGADDWATFMEAGACYYGHIHDPHGTYYPVPNSAVVMCNNGALSRGSLHEATLKRKPKVTLFDSTKPGLEMFEAIDVPHLPPEEAFALEAKAEDDASHQRMADFLDGLGEEVVQTQSIEQVSAHLSDYGALTPSARDKAIDLIEWAMK